MTGYWNSIVGSAPWIATIMLAIVISWQAYWRPKALSKPTFWRLTGIVDKDDIRTTLEQYYSRQWGGASKFTLDLVQRTPTERWAIVRSVIQPPATGYSVDKDFLGITPLFTTDDAVVE
jgi:hypothetical protein